MKIAIIGTTACGVLGFRKELIESLVNSGHQVHVFALHYTEQQRMLVYKMGAVPAVYNINRTGLNPVADIMETLKLMRQLKAIQPDLVFSYFSKPVIFGTIAARLAGVKKIIAMLEGLGFMFTEQPEGLSKKTKLLQRIQVFLYKISFVFLHKLIFLNPDDPHDLLVKNNIKVKRMVVLGGIGLDLAQYPYVKPHSGAVSFLFIGRLLKEKGINEFIEAAKQVKQRYSEATFTVLGGIDEGNPGAFKHSELAQLVDAGVIVYPGLVDNVAEYIAHASVFVLPSYREGVPRSTQEAMAIGRPIITTDVPGCRETVVDGVNGFLIKPWDAQGLAEKMIYFIQHPYQIEPMGLASYQMAQDKFDATKVNTRLIKLLGA